MRSTVTVSSPQPPAGLLLTALFALAALAASASAFSAMIPTRLKAFDCAHRDVKRAVVDLVGLPECPRNATPSERPVRVSARRYDCKKNLQDTYKTTYLLWVFLCRYEVLSESWRNRNTPVKHLIKSVKFFKNFS